MATRDPWEGIAYTYDQVKEMSRPEFERRRAYHSIYEGYKPHMQKGFSIHSASAASGVQSGAGADGRGQPAFIPAVFVWRSAPAAACLPPVRGRF